MPKALKRISGRCLIPFLKMSISWFYFLKTLEDYTGAFLYEWWTFIYRLTWNKYKWKQNRSGRWRFSKFTSHMCCRCCCKISPELHWNNTTISGPAPLTRVSWFWFFFRIYTFADSSRVLTIVISILLIIYGSFR